MKSYRNWQVVNENYAFNPQIDGKPLEPTTLAQAETQLHWLCTMIRSGFAYDPKFAKVRDQIHQITSAIDKLADKLGGDPELRNVPWGKGEAQD